jgi:photosystem II stability/assembly factor-like uncharacterized protein
VPRRPRHTTLAFYRTSNQGRHWALAATLEIATAQIAYPGPPTQLMTAEPLVSIANDHTWWVANVAGSAVSARFSILITVDGGRSWTDTVSDLPLGSDSINAASATNAWATTEVYGRHDQMSTELEQTTDGGRRWTAADPP